MQTLNNSSVEKTLKITDSGDYMTILEITNTYISHNNMGMHLIRQKVIDVYDAGTRRKKCV